MKEKYRKMKNLFLRQSYLDSWEDYQRSLNKSSFRRTMPFSQIRKGK